MEGHTDSVTCMVKDELILFTGSDDCTIRSWNLVEFAPAGTIGSHNEAIKSLLLIKESGVLVSCGLDFHLKFWYYKRNVLLKSVRKLQPIYTMDYLSKSGELLLGTESGTVISQPI